MGISIVKIKEPDNHYIPIVGIPFTDKMVSLHWNDLV